MLDTLPTLRYLQFMKQMTHEQLLRWIKRKYPKTRDFALAVGITTQAAYNLLAGKTMPSGKVLEKLGIEEHTRMYTEVK